MFDKLSKMLKIFKFAANAVLKDGTEILIDGNLDIGVNIYVVTADGDQPLPDGEYELGAPYEGYIVVVEGGVISNVLEPVEDEPVEDTPEEAPVEAEDEETETPTEEPTDEISLEDQIISINEKLTSILERLEALELSNADLSKENEELKKQNENFSAQVDGFQKKLEITNGAEPIKKKTDVDNTSAFISQSSNVRKLQALKKQLKG